MELKNHYLLGVRERRRLLNLNATYMASRLNVTPITYYRFERGERRVYLDYAVTIAAILGCALEDLGRFPTPEEALELMKRSHARRIAEVQGLNPDQEAIT